MEYDICRLCGIKSEHLAYIFDELNNLAQMINETLRIKVSQDDDSKYICLDCYNKVISYYDFTQNVLAHSKESETKIISFYEVDRKEKLESVVISKLHNDMIYACPNCNKDLMILIKSNSQDGTFQISLIVVDQMERTVEESSQIFEDTMEFIDVSTEKSDTEDELHEVLSNYDIVDVTDDNERDINGIGRSQKEANPRVTLQKTRVSRESNKSTKRKFQESISIGRPVNPTKSPKLEAKVGVMKQNELSSDHNRSSITDLMTFQSVNNDVECEEMKIEEEHNTGYMTEKKCLDKNLTMSRAFGIKLEAAEQNESSDDYVRSNAVDLIILQSENDNMECLGDDEEMKDDGTMDVTKIENEGYTNDTNVPRSNVRQICNLCGTCYISQMKYEFHMERHKLNKVDRCVCTICDKECKNENLLWNHYLNMHKSPMRYICLDCNTTFTTKLNLGEHQKKRNHSSYKTMQNIKTDSRNRTADSNQRTVSKRKCAICRKLIKDMDLNVSNDVAICAFCVDPGACLVDGEVTKPVTQRQYHCSKCRKHFMRRERLEFHEMRHNENMDEFVCSTCGREFSGENSLYEHYLFVHKGARPHVCEVCGKSFQLKARLKEHYRKHTGEKPYQCEICGHRCMTTHSLKFHKKSHLALRHTCEICGKSFLKKQNLNEHLEKHWTNDKSVSLSRIFTCPVCSCDLPTFRMLRHHMIGTHQLDRQDPLIMKQKPWYECDECQEKFKHQMSLKAHKEKVHEGKILPRVFQCDVCEVVYKVKSMLIKHIRSKHSDEKRYKCAQCDVTFADGKTLQDHVLLHADKRLFTCEHCNVSFRCREARDAHCRKHTNNRSLYQCADCNKSFSSHASHSNHREKVHGDNECSQCGKKFGDMQKYRIHLNNHLGENLSKLKST
ncbi:PREDICTED: zinc finger protein 135-like [Wasmannia auropunctata]|uniref:zinc finger protein 135-like n=1 Tax=Wasmannia auropunctata TaxID=64793 RepID=UPI0005EE72DC|nr:PREDICTED: zinc finger protein 135-like [Wasmannia auropunctata]